MRPAASIAAPNSTMRRMPSHPDSQPAAMPPKAAPIKVKAPAAAGAARSVPNSAAIGRSATAESNGAP